MADQEILWRQYSLHVDMYKFYLDLAIKINVFYYAVTGIILAYYFQNPSNHLSWVALLLPVAFSLAIGSVFFYGAGLLGVVRAEMFAIRDKLKLETAPEVMVLVVFLRVFGAIMVVTGLVLGAFVLLQIRTRIAV